MQKLQLIMEVDKTDMMENTADSQNMQKMCHDVRSLQSDVSTNHMIITFGTAIHSVNVQLMKRNKHKTQSCKRQIQCATGTSTAAEIGTATNCFFAGQNHSTQF